MQQVDSRVHRLSASIVPSVKTGLHAQALYDLNEVVQVHSHKRGRVWISTKMYAAIQAGARVIVANHQWFKLYFGVQAVYRIYQQLLASIQLRTSEPIQCNRQVTSVHLIHCSVTHLPLLKILFKVNIADIDWVPDHSVHVRFHTQSIHIFRLHFLALENKLVSNQEQTSNILSMWTVQCLGTFKN